jgi:putative addiction module component (TIGR02574 family)
MESVEQLARKAAALEPVERLRLVEEILCGLDRIDPDIEQRWAAEAAARYAAYQRGEIETVDWQDIKKRYEIVVTAVAHLHRDPAHYQDRIV